MFLTNNPITRLLAALVIVLVNFFLMINYINKATFIQQQQVNLEKKITLEQARQTDQQNNDQAVVREEIQRKLKTGELDKVPTTEIGRIVSQ